MHGVDDDQEQYWFVIMLFGILLWGIHGLKSKTINNIKYPRLPVKYHGGLSFMSHSIGAIMWTFAVIGSIASISIELRYELFRYELLLPMIMSVIVPIRITILFKNGFSDIKNYIKTTFKL